MLHKQNTKSTNQQKRSIFTRPRKLPRAGRFCFLLVKFSYLCQNKQPNGADS